MRTFNVIVSYDISSDKRLKKVSKMLEKHGCRIQLSVFLLLDVTKNIIQELITQLIEIMDKNEDDIRIYKINLKESINLNNAINLKSPNIFIQGCENG
jgi:CRISPR-associated protein Cas2